jgi:hypothetical protein
MRKVVGMQVMRSATAVSLVPIERGNGEKEKVGGRGTAEKVRLQLRHHPIIR